jgi:hypothetical protein
MKSSVTLVNNPIGRSYVDPSWTITKGVTEKTSKVLSWGDTGHYGYPDFPPDRNVGGSFQLAGYEFYTQPITVPRISTSALGNYLYEGAFVVTEPAFSIPPIGDGSAYGATAYSRMKPTSPSFQALNALYELKDLPGMLKQRFTPDLMGASNYWLALQFGWKPLLADVRNFVHTQMNGQKRLAQLIRDEGKPVRRRIHLADSSTDAVFTEGNSYGALAPQIHAFYYVKTPHWKERRWQVDKVWASSRFRYWLPPGPRDVNWRRRMLARIFGLNPTPSVVYNAIPWSWLVDWFTNVGDVIENLDAGVADRLAADYCYVMRDTSYHCLKEVEGYFKTQSGAPVNMSGFSNSISYNRSRIPGDPFGFATNPNSLTGMQLSILGALGLSRLR